MKTRNLTEKIRESKTYKQARNIGGWMYTAPLIARIQREEKRNFAPARVGQVIVEAMVGGMLNTGITYSAYLAKVFTEVLTSPEMPQDIPEEAFLINAGIGIAGNIITMTTEMYRNRQKTLDMIAETQRRMIRKAGERINRRPPVSGLQHSSEEDPEVKADLEGIRMDEDLTRRYEGFSRKLNPEKGEAYRIRELRKIREKKQKKDDDDLEPTA